MTNNILPTNNPCMGTRSLPKTSREPPYQDYTKFSQPISLFGQAQEIYLSGQNLANRVQNNQNALQPNSLPPSYAEHMANTIAPSLPPSYKEPTALVTPLQTQNVIEKVVACFARLITALIQAICDFFLLGHIVKGEDEVNPSTKPLYRIVNKPNPHNPQSAPPISCYLDLGVMSGQLWGLYQWSPSKVFNLDGYRAYLGAIFAQLKAAGVSQLDLSFAQIASIDCLLNNGQGTASSDDVVVALMQQFGELPNEPGYLGAFQELINLAHENGMKVDLAFGGENGTAMTICGEGETPAGQATKLVQFMENYGIDAVDFDLESTVFSTVNPPEIAQGFFSSLHDQLSAQGKKSTLTIEGGIGDWAEGYLKELFFDANGNPIFTQLFHNLNLMLYSASQYYLAADPKIDPNDGWTVGGWLDIIGKENAGMVNIGFEDAIAYQDPKANASAVSYNITTQDPGVAAAQILQQLQAQLIKDDYTTPLGGIFFWPDENKVDPNKSGQWTRYQLFGLYGGGPITADFATQMMQSFYQTMASSLS